MIELNSLVSRLSVRYCLYIFFVAFIIRIINILFLDISAESILIEDAAMYWQQTTGIMQYGAFVFFQDGELFPITERMPLYYYMLFCVRYIFGDGLIAPIVIQVIIDSVTCVLIGLIATFYNKKLGLVSGLLAAVSPNLIINSASILTDSLFLFLFSIMLLFFMLFMNNMKLKYLVLAGIFLGFSIMTRTVAQLLPFFLAIVVFIACIINSKDKKTIFLYPILFLFINVLILFPMLYRNYTEFNTLQLTSQNGTHIAGWVNPLVRQKYDQTPHAKGARELAEKIKFDYELKFNVKLEKLNAFEESKVFSKEGLKDLLNYPLISIVSAWIEGIIINIASPALVIDQRIRKLSTLNYSEIEGSNILIRVVKYLYNNSLLYTFIILSMLLLLPISILLKCYGFINLINIYPKISILMVFYILYFLLINGPVASPKYRLPIEPALIILTAIGILEFYEKWLGINKRSFVS